MVTPAPKPLPPSLSNLPKFDASKYGVPLPKTTPQAPAPLFSQYVYDYMDGTPGGGGGYSALKPLSGAPVDLPKPDSVNEPGFINNAIDFLGGTLKAVTNIAYKALEMPEKYDELKRREAAGGEVSLGDRLAPVGDVIGAAPAGLFSFYTGNEEDKHWGADVVEKVSDVVSRNDPNYVDVKDNVDPVFKGITGFAIDVLADPLTWIPGAQYVKAAKLALRGTKAVGNALGKGAVKATEFVAGKVKKTPAVDPAAPANVTADILAKEPIGYTLTTKTSGKQNVREFATEAEALAALKTSQGRSTRPWKAMAQGEKALRGINYYNIEPKFPTAQTINAAEEALPAAALIDDAGRAVDEAAIKGISATDAIAAKFTERVGSNPSFAGDVSSLIKSLKNAPKVAAKAKPMEVLSAGKWLDSVYTAITKGQLDDFPVGSITLGGGDNIKKTSLRTMNYALREYGKLKKSGTQTGLVKAIEAQIFGPMYNKYAAALKAGNQADLLGNILSKGTPEEILKEAAVTTALQRTIAVLSQNEAKARALFTPGVYDDLMKMDQKEWKVFLDTLPKILKSNGLATAFGPMSSSAGARAALSVFDISPEMYNDAINVVGRNVEDLVESGPASVGAALRDIPNGGNVNDVLREQLTLRAFEPEVIDIVVRRVSEALNEAIRKNFDPEFLDDIYKFISPDGTFRTEEFFGAGIGKHPNAFNTHTQWDFFNILSQKLTDDFANVITKTTGKNKGEVNLGYDLASQKEMAIIPAMRAIEDFLEAKGVPITMDYNGEVLNLRFTDLYDGLQSVFSKADDIRWLRLVMFNGNTGVAPTKMMDAAVEAIRGGDVEQIYKVLTDNKRRNILLDADGSVPALAQGDLISNWLAGDRVESKFGFYPGDKMPTKMIGGRTYKQKDTKSGYYGMWDNKVAAAKLAEAISTIAPTLTKLDNARATELTARGVTEYRTMSPLVAGQILAATKTPELAGQAIRMAAAPGKIVGDYAKGMNATQLGASMANAAIRQGLMPSVQSAAAHSIKVADAVASGDPAKVATATRNFLNETRVGDAETGRKIEEYVKGVSQAEYDAMDDAARAQFDDMAGELTYDTSRSLGAKAVNGEAAIVSFMNRILHPLKQAFTPDFKMRPEEFMWAAREERKSNMFVKQFVAKRLVPLNKLARDPRFKPLLDGKTTVFQQAIRNIQEGVQGQGVVGEAQRSLTEHLAYLVDVGADGANSILASPFGRAGIGLKMLNDYFKKYQVLGSSGAKAGDDLIDIAAAVATSEASGGKISVFQAGIDQWKTWKIENPLEFIGRMDAAAVRMAADVSFVRNFEAEALAKGLSAAKPGNGFVKLVSTGDSYFGDLLPKDAYFHPDIAEVFHAIDVKSRSSKNLQGDFGAFINKTLDPILGEWKYAITLIRPGHHFRNLFGDLSMTYFAEGVRNFRPSSVDAFRLMSMTNDYQGVDIVRTLNGLKTTIPKGVEVMVSGNLGKNGSGIKASLTYSDVIVAAKERGLMLPAQVVEDLFDAEIKKSFIAKSARAVSRVATLNLSARGGKLEKGFSTISEYREHTVKLQHYSQIIRNALDGKGVITGIGKIVYPKTIDELLDIAARRVMKYHPDVSTLTAFETKYMRRIIPFYSWTKQAVIAMGEATVMAPGRIMTIPKASYNLAIAMGVDPYSLSDPFPTDQLFPSFLTEEMTGPQFQGDSGKYYGFNPGIASADIYNMLAPDPLRGILGSTNPLLKAPLEAISGTNLGTGAPIRDYSDWLDSQIPGVNYISNISGYSVTGSIVGGLTRGQFDPQYQVAAGNKGAWDRSLSAINWLTGLGIRSYSRPNYINYAEIELRNRLGGEEKTF
jgi:hypothetical protein